MHAVDDRELILSTTVTLLIERGVGALDVDIVCAAAGLERSAYHRHFDSLAAVYTAVILRLLDAHVENPDGAVGAAGDLLTALRASVRAVWDLVEGRIDEHHAIHVLLLGQVGNPELEAAMGFSLHDTQLRVAEQWLMGIERAHAVEWAVPVPQLAVLVQATLDGLIVDFVARRDSAQVHEVLEIFAGHLAGTALLV